MKNVRRESFKRKSGETCIAEKSNQNEYKNSNRVEGRQEYKTEQREYKGQQIPSKTHISTSENKTMTINDLYRK